MITNPIPNKKKPYVAPQSSMLHLQPERMMAGSITGSAPDSDDSEFGAPARNSVEFKSAWD